MNPDQFARPDDAVVNPSNPDHFMSIRRVDQLVTIEFEGQIVAQSSDALRVMEVGRKTYDPVHYFPRRDVVAQLRPSAAISTHCPIKGDANYFDLLNDQGEEIADKVAWSYEYTFGFSRQLEDRIAFFPERVEVTETPLPTPEIKEAKHAQET